MTVMTGGRIWYSSSSSSSSSSPKNSGAERRLLLLAGVNQSDLCADLGSEQGNHVVCERLGRGHHLALKQEEANYVAGRAIKARAELLGRGAPLDDHFMVWYGRARGQVRRDLYRLELLHVATPASRPALGGPASSDRAASSRSGWATWGVAAGRANRGRLPRRRGSAASWTPAVSRRERWTLETRAATAWARSDRATRRRPGPTEPGRDGLIPGGRQARVAADSDHPVAVDVALPAEEESGAPKATVAVRAAAGSACRTGLRARCAATAVTRRSCRRRGWSRRGRYRSL